MKPLVLVLVLVLLGGGAWLLLEGNDGADDSNTPLPETGTDDGTPEKDLSAGTGNAGLGATKDPKTVAQKPELTELARPATALLVARAATTWTKTLEMSCQGLKELSYSVWYLGAGNDAPAAGDARGLPALTAKPTADYLEEHDIDALLFDSADPNAFPKAFWETVEKRVRGGQMGLYFRPNFPPAPSHEAKSPAVHPALSHPVMKALLPVSRVMPLTGTPLPGVFPKEPQPIRVTEEGTRHPATRFVTDPEDSLHAWTLAAEGDGAFTTKFCYPVDEVKEKDGAQVLANVVAASDIPAIIVGKPGGPRVLWMGNADFGRRAHFVKEKSTLQGILLNQWLVWLVGQAAE